METSTAVGHARRDRPQKGGAVWRLPRQRRGLGCGIRVKTPGSDSNVGTLFNGLNSKAPDRKVLVFEVPGTKGIDGHDTETIWKDLRVVSISLQEIRRRCVFELLVKQAARPWLRQQVSGIRVPSWSWAGCWGHQVLLASVAKGLRRSPKLCIAEFGIGGSRVLGSQGIGPSFTPARPTKSARWLVSPARLGCLMFARTAKNASPSPVGPMRARQGSEFVKFQLCNALVRQKLVRAPPCHDEESAKVGYTGE